MESLRCPFVNFVESHNYCYGCGKDNVPTWDVRLSWRTHEELCENCLHELYEKLEDSIIIIWSKIMLGLKSLLLSLIYFLHLDTNIGKSFVKDFVYELYNKEYSNDW